MTDRVEAKAKINKSSPNTKKNEPERQFYES